MEPVRIGIVGLGNMGSMHARDCMASDELDLVALCDIDADRLAAISSEHGVPGYANVEELFGHEGLEAVLIATPHYDHTPIAIEALGRGIHVLCEKPVGVHVKDVRRMIDAYEAARQTHPALRFGAMFQQRTLSHWLKIKELMDTGALGRLVRATWIITTWFRTQYYYDTGSWRATWSGEGGGVLLNQCPHNLDLYQWLFGMPKRIVGVASIGKYHRIEVEDEVTGIFEHENGMVGHFITTTAESPGTNRLEIVGEFGKLVYEDGSLSLDRNEQSMLEASDTVPKSFMTVPHSRETIDLTKAEGGQHRLVTEVFARSVRTGSPLVAEAPEGLGSVELANGVLMSHFTGKPVDLPLDGDAYEALLKKLIAGSTFRKDRLVTAASADMGASFK